MKSTKLSPVSSTKAAFERQNSAAKNIKEEDFLYAIAAFMFHLSM